jgi:putative membrane protein
MQALDHDRVEAAVRQAETGSRGEIVVVVSGEVSRYREVPLIWGTAAALLIPPIAFAAGLQPLDLAALGGVWEVAHQAAVKAQVGLAVVVYTTLQVIVFALVTWLVAIPQVRRVLTPRFLKRRRVGRSAETQFAAIAARAMGSDTGVLIFIAPVEHQVEILADASIHQKVGNPLWEKAAQAVKGGMQRGDPTGGVVEAVTLCGEAMREHFPATGDNPDYLPNRPVEI